MKLTPWLPLIALATAAVAAGATPSTLVWIPSTDLQADRTWHLGIDNYFAPPRAGVDNTPVYDFGLEYGFAGGRAEVGLDYLTGFADPIFFNAKYRLSAETDTTPAVAVGAYNLGTRAGVTDFNMVYLLASKILAPLRLTLGYCHGNPAALGRDENMLMAGVDAVLTADGKWWGAVDYQSGKNVFGALSAGVSYAFAPNVSLLVGYDWYNDRDLSDTVTTQLDLNF